MKQKGFVLFLITFLVLSLLSIAFIQAPPNAYTNGGSTAPCTADPNSIFPAFIQEGYCNTINVWKGTADFGAMASVAKLFLLFLVIILVFSALNSADFPESDIVKVLLSFIVGFLGTVLISNNEVISILQSYSALGITLTLFFPIIILGFLSVVVASKANPIGIYLQRIMWLIYSLYLFIRFGFLLLAKAVEGKTGDSYDGVKKLIEFFIKDASKIQTDNTIITILFLVSIVVFIFFVLMNKHFIKWLAEEKTEAASLAHKTKLDKAKAAVDNLANYIEGK